MKSIDGKEGGGSQAEEREQEREPLRGRGKIHAHFARASEKSQVKEEKRFMRI